MSDFTDVPDIFLETVSLHSKLVGAFLFMKSVTIKGITSLIENSHKLLSLVIITTKCICDERSLKVNLKKFKSKLKKKYCHWKLFVLGTIKVVQNNKLPIEYLMVTLNCNTHPSSLYYDTYVCCVIQRERKLINWFSSLYSTGVYLIKNNF